MDRESVPDLGRSTPALPGGNLAALRGWGLFPDALRRCACDCLRRRTFFLAPRHRARAQTQSPAGRRTNQFRPTRAHARAQAAVASLRAERDCQARSGHARHLPLAARRHRGACCLQRRPVRWRGGVRATYSGACDCAYAWCARERWRPVSRLDLPHPD